MAEPTVEQHEDVFRDALSDAIAVAQDAGVSYDSLIGELEMKAMALREEEQEGGE